MALTAGSSGCLMTLNCRHSATALVAPGAHAMTVALFFVALSVNVGMWVERFVIVVQSLHHDFVPSTWAMYYPDDMGLG